MNQVLRDLISGGALWFHNCKGQGTKFDLSKIHV